MTALETAATILPLTLAALGDRISALTAQGAVVAEAGGVWTMTLHGVSGSSAHSPAGAARAWAEAVMTPQPAGIVTGPAGMAGVDNEVIDPFLVNAGR